MRIQCPKCNQDHLRTLKYIKDYETIKIKNRYYCPTCDKIIHIKILLISCEDE